VRGRRVKVKLNNVQMEAIFTAMKGGISIVESIANMELNIKPSEVRRQLVGKYTHEEVIKVVRENIGPAMTPERRAKSMVMRIVQENPDSIAEIKIALQAYIDSLLP
jgi:nucleoside-triphosphatase THEP1